MIFLLITIALNILISSLFKFFPKYGINTLQAIVVNYAVCVATGCVYMGAVPDLAVVSHTSWFPWSALVGVMFMSIFSLLAYCTIVDGITTAVIANKLSLAIPVVFAIIVFREHIGFIKVAGILLAFPAIYFTAKAPGENGKPQNLFWPALLFLGGGALDTVMNFIQHNFLDTPNDQALYSLFCFFFAAIVGASVVVFQIIRGKLKFEIKNVVAGICLGIPNYFSIYFYVRTLHSNFLQSSATIPVLNIGILIASALVALIAFRERFGWTRIAGLAISVIAILMIAFGDKSW